METNANVKLENESSKSSFSTAPNSSPPTPNPPKDLIENVLLSVKIGAPHQRNVDGEVNKRIHKKEAICKVCNNILPEERVVVMRKCQCNFTLMHRECGSEWSKNTKNGDCDVCQQDIQIIYAILSRMINEQTPIYPEYLSSRQAEHHAMRGRGTKDDEFLIVNVKMPHRNVDGEQDEKIPKMEAICKICFCTFQEDNVLKIKCKCRFTLIHEECVKKLPHNNANNKCDVCEQDVQNIPVTLSDAQLSFNTSSSTPKSIWNKIAGCFKAIGKA